MKILIARTDAMGDTILTLPMAALIKKRIPGAQVAFVVAPPSLPLLENHPYVDRVWSLGVGGGGGGLLQRQAFAQWQPTHYFYVGGGQLPSLFACYKKVPFRGGLLSRWPTFILLNRGVRQRRSLEGRHESLYNLRLLQDLAGDVREEEVLDFPPAVTLAPEESKQGQAEWRAMGGGGGGGGRDGIFIHPGMRTAQEITWPTKNYAHLIERLQREHPGRLDFVISYTPRDGAYIDRLKAALRGKRGGDDNPIIYLDGSQKGLRHSMRILAQTKVFIGPSTGPTHLANVLGVKTIGLYPPLKNLSPQRWGPFYRDDPSRTQILTLSSDSSSPSVAQVAQCVANFLL